MNERQLLASVVYLLCNGSTAAGGGSVGQLMVYSGASPTAAGIVPANQNAAAIAYSDTGVGSTYTWNITSHQWQ